MTKHDPAVNFASDLPFVTLGTPFLSTSPASCRHVDTLPSPLFFYISLPLNQRLISLDFLLVISLK